MKNCTAACSSCSNENKYCLDELTWKWASVDPRQVKTHLYPKYFSYLHFTLARGAGKC